MSKFFCNNHSSNVEDSKLIAYAEAIYGKSGRSVLENLLAKASIRLRDKYPHESDEQIAVMANRGLYDMLSRYVEE
ncbi:hypothetical protein MUG87_07730 [Ectobacillus sp. JY-23]|uniref:hypothetical protein n=1 Tax=Ectobacillus sp. JY-23 TaxID=2933872 RepID=UPI001FF42D21|nr:hypothetical protein [Ectobacillus sp. JY-23]UOY93987.1 hypothetical protein MUG87_07730 [Ectobacillus sp. JY-23]